MRPDGLAFRHELARRAIEQQPAGDRASRLLNAGRRRGAARAGPARARAADAPRGRGGRRRRPSLAVGPRGRARGGAGRLAPPGAGALRGGRARTRTGWRRAEQRRRARRLRLGALQRRTASARRCDAGSAAGGALRRASATRSPLGAVPGAGVAPLVHGRGDRRRRGLRASARCGSSRPPATTRRWPRRRSTRARSSPWPRIPSRRGAVLRARRRAGAARRGAWTSPRCA